jgi:hypothetical protein
MASNPKPEAVPAHRINERRITGILCFDENGSFWVVCLKAGGEQANR